MAITVKFYSFSKKINSTAQPTGDPIWSGSCLVKSGSQIVSPDLEIGLSASTNVSKWNYAHIPDFNRYYFVTDTTFDNGQWVFHLECDVLATYKTAIGGSTQYVARAQSQFNGNIPDNLYPVETMASYDMRPLAGSGSATFSSDYKDSSGKRHFVVGIINNDMNSNIGGVSYYAMNNAELGKLKRLLLGTATWTGVAASAEIQTKLDVNPFQYVVSCKYFPCEISTTGDNNMIPVGWWFPMDSIGGYPTFISGGYINSTPQILNNYGSVPKHPQSSTRGAFLNAAPFTKYSLLYPMLGELELDTAAMRDQDEIETNLYIDYISGCGFLKVYANNSGGYAQYIADEMTGNIGVNMTIAQASMDVSTYSPETKMFSDIVSPIPVAGKIANMINTIAESVMRGKSMKQSDSGLANLFDAASAGVTKGYNKLTSSLSGSAGSIAAYYGHSQPQLCSRFSLLASESIADYGRPLCDVKTISSLSGFIKCGHAELALTASSTEQQNVINFMEGGFYYE